MHNNGEWVQGGAQYGQSDPFGMAGLSSLGVGSDEAGRAAAETNWAEVVKSLITTSGQAYQDTLRPKDAWRAPAGPMPGITPGVQSSSNWLLYGGIGLLAVAGIWYMMKKKKR